MTSQAISAEYVMQCLTDASKTLAALPWAGHTTALAQSHLEPIREAIEAYGWTPSINRPVVPAHGKIDAMNTIFSWLAFIPENKRVLRRVVCLRCLIHPRNERPVFSWRRIGIEIGADHKAVKRWYINGIDIIVLQLRRIPNPDLPEIEEIEYSLDVQD